MEHNGQLTDAEHDLMAKISEVSNAFATLIKPGEHPGSKGDWAEVAADIHRLQMRVLSMAAARAYPGRYRGLCGPAGGDWMRSQT